MINKTKVVSIFLFLTVFIMLVSFGEQKAEWKGKIEYENGVKVIKNPEEPLYGEIKFELEEDLSIGNEQDENYMFYRVRDVEVDGQGNIYVADMANYRIQKFDRDGKYLETIGRQGQGPGEFELPTKVRVDEKTGNIYVKDGVINIDIFNRQGEYIKSIHLQNVIHDFRPLENENILAVISKASESDLDHTHALCKINFDGEIENIYSEFPYTLFAKKMEGGTLSISTGYELSLKLSKLDSSTSVHGYSREYELKVIDSKGELLYKIKKDEPYPKFTSKEKRGFKKIPLPEYKPYFFSIITDNEGRIYVQRNRQTWKEPDVHMKVDIFSTDGYFLYEATLPPCTWVIKDGFLYTYALDEDEGMGYIRRYKIKNWNQIKEGI